MKALVTGATGFVGTNLVNRLKSEGWKLNLLLRPKGDLSNIDSLKRAVEKVEVVFHLAAALPHHRLSDREYWQTNVEGTKNLLEACKEKKIKKFIHVSTVGIYDKPPSTYSITKKKAEELVVSYSKKYNLSVVIIRPTIAYGPGDIRPGFLNLFRVIKKRIFVRIGDGSNPFHTIYIDNLVDALILAAKSRKAIGEDFVIGDDPCPKMKQIIKEMFKLSKMKFPSYYIPTRLAYLAALFFDFISLFGLPVILPSKRVRFMTESKRYNIDKAKKILKWRPKIELNDGLLRTYNWYKKEGLI